MNGSPLRRAARGATSPLRTFFNDHFEMVKDEVRTNNLGPELRAMVTDIESALVEHSLHQARAMSRVATDLEHLDARIAELERVVGRLADVVAAQALEAPDRP